MAEYVLSGVVKGDVNTDVVSNDPDDDVTSLIRWLEVTTLSVVVPGAVLGDVVITEKCEVAGCTAVANAILVVRDFEEASFCVMITAVSVLIDASVADRCDVTGFTVAANVVPVVCEREEATSRVVPGSVLSDAVISGECDVAGFTTADDVISVIRLLEGAEVVVITRSDLDDDLR